MIMNCLLPMGVAGPANLEYLKNRKKDGSLVTDLAQKIFDESQALTLGVGHYAKKYATGAGVFVGTIALPVAVAGTAIYCSLPSTKQGWYTLGMSGAGAGLTNQGVSKLTGINIGSKLITLVSMALVTGAALASSTMMGSYTEIEDEVKKAQERARGDIIQSLTDAYNQVAQTLMDKIQEVDNPRELFLLKAEVEILETQLEEIHAQFAKLGLNGVQSAGILAEFSSALNAVQKTSLVVDAKEGSKKFNFELMTMEEIPLDRAVAGAIPTSVRNHVQHARDNQLGMLHSIRKYVDSTLKGAIVGTTAVGATALACLVAQQMFKNNVNISMNGVVAVGAAGGLFAGVKTMFNRFQSYTDERLKKDTIVRENYVAAKEQLEAVYAGLAESLAACGNDKEAKAESIRLKLPAIKQQIANLQIPGLDIEEVLAPLYRVLASAQ